MTSRTQLRSYSLIKELSPLTPMMTKIKAHFNSKESAHYNIAKVLFNSVHNSKLFIQGK